MDYLLDHRVELLLSIGWALYLVALAAWIVLQKRSPLATLAWVLALAALPVAGFGIYFLFGPQKIHRRRLRRQRLRRLHHCDPGSPALPRPVVAAPLRPLATLIERATGTPVVGARRIELLVGGAATYAALFEALARAQQQIHLEYYILEPDAIGGQLRDILIERAGAGVAVRLLVDAVGSSRLTRHWLAPLRAAGVEIARFHPFRLATLRPLLNFRTHRKIVVIDGALAFTGGINIADEHDARLSAGAWHDLHLRIEGPLVGRLQAVFAEDWLYARRRPLPERELYPDLAGGDIAAQVVASGPDGENEAIHRAYLEAIQRAQRRVWLVTPYFAPSEPVLYALGNAALRGVEVRLLLPSRSDSRIVTAAARSYYDDLLAPGVLSHEYLPTVLHAKALLVDDDCALLGSANFDLRSFRLNFEVAVAVYDPRFATTLAGQLEQDFARSARITLPRKIGPGARLLEALARLASPLI